MDKELKELGLSDRWIEKISSFYALLVEGNKTQNLTRLIEPQAFIDGHLIDVLALMKLELPIPFLDLGSGCGVPGLLHCLLTEKEWTLVESERSKADFLKETVNSLGISNICTVIHNRMENIQKEVEPSTITARAVGPVGRIYEWIRYCSTWNKLVLFKGPKWEEEKQALNIQPLKDKVVLSQCIEYPLGTDSKKKLIVLSRR